MAQLCVIDGAWKVAKRIGSGSFGDVFSAQHLETQEMVAVKMENSRKEKFSYLEKEYYLLQKLSRQNGEGISQVFYFGFVQHYRVLVMEYLGPSLDDLMQYCGNKFSLKTTIMLADQMVSRLEFLHKNGILHRDIKPDNFLVGLKYNYSLVYIIDFGLSGMYIDPDTRQHLHYRRATSIVGTLHFWSLKCHEGVEQSRRDDMESLGYVLMYFMKGTLPWMGMKEKNIQKKVKMVYKGKNVQSKTLCRDLPSQFADYLTYCRALEFDETPDYDLIRSSFRQCLVDTKEEFDFKFDWHVKNDKSLKR